jgi:hypothetical protein
LPEPFAAPEGPALPEPLPGLVPPPLGTLPRPADPPNAPASVWVIWVAAIVPSVFGPTTITVCPFERSLSEPVSLLVNFVEVPVWTV